MFQELRMLKDNQLLLMLRPMDLTKNGRLFILTRKERLRLRDSMKNLDSTSIDHSTLSQSFHSTELLRCTVMLMCGSRDGETTLSNSNSSLMKRPRLLETITGRTTLLKSKAMEIATI
jgi:hypothetical protein